MSRSEESTRAYIKETDIFGDVQRRRIFGKTAVVVKDDEGVLRGFCGAAHKDRVVDTETSLDGNGVSVELPVDTKTEGVAILGTLNIPREQQVIMFAKFMATFDKDQRRAYMDDWVSKKDDPELSAEFVEGLMEAVDDDESFVLKEGSKALAQVDPDVRTGMFGKIMVSMDKEQREAYILRWMSVKNDVKKKDEFLQEMYELLMDDDDYIQMEGKRAFTDIRVVQDKQGEVFAKFMELVDRPTREAYVKKWRSIRTSKSQKTKFLRDMMRLAE